MEITKVIKKTLAVSAAVVMLATSSFAAQLDVLLKDRATGENYGSPENVRIQVLDGVGNIVGDKLAEDLGDSRVGAVFNDLVENEPYTILTKHTKEVVVEQNGTVNVTTIGRKTVMFGEGEANKTREMYIGNPVASNVSLRITGAPPAWSEGEITLTPVPSNRVSMNKDSFTFIIPLDEHKNGEIVLPSIPAGRYNWTARSIVPEGEDPISNGRARTIRTDASVNFNIAASQKLYLTTIYKLRNADRTPAEFSGENISFTIKDSEGNIVRQGNLTATSGLEIIDNSGHLYTHGAYTLTATLSKNGIAVARSQERAFNMFARDRAINITFETLANINVDFIVKNSRTGAAVNASATIKDREGNIIETVTAVDGKISTSMVRNYRYTVEISAEGYATRTISLTPYENHVREINLLAI